MRCVTIFSLTIRGCFWAGGGGSVVALVVVGFARPRFIVLAKSAQHIDKTPSSLLFPLVKKNLDRPQELVQNVAGDGSPRSFNRG